MAMSYEALYQDAECIQGQCIFRVEHSNSRFDSIHLANRFESIRFPKKIGTSDSIVLVVGICLPNDRSTDYCS